MDEEEYSKLPMVATIKLLGTKRSAILDDGEFFEISYNEYDICELIGELNFFEHYRQLEQNAFFKGDALVSYQASSGTNIVTSLIEEITRNIGSLSIDGIEKTNDIHSIICQEIPSLSNLDPADLNDVLLLSLDPADLNDALIVSLSRYID